ncbi:MAG TPA: poly-beta-1,6-N-acetyl-D-glucosamine biosynthesis protein PgaD [Solimonas sp.]
MPEPIKDPHAFEVQPPIIDAARAPMSSFLDNKATPSAVWMFAWLHFLRPLLLILFWLLAGWYAYRHFFSLPMVIENRWLLLLYFSVALLMAGSMLYLAIYRRRHAHHRRGGDRGVSLETVAESLNLPADKLGTWQQARLLVAHHDDEGQLSKVDVLVDADGRLRRALRTKGRPAELPAAAAAPEVRQATNPG